MTSELTRKEFEALLTKAAQPLPKPEQPPAQEIEQTSVTVCQGMVTLRNETY